LIKNPGETDIHSIIIYKGERTIFSYHRPKNYKIQKWDEPKWIYYSSLPKKFEPFQQELINYLQKHPKILTAFSPGVYHFKVGYKAYSPFLKITDLLLVNKEEACRILEQAGEKTGEISKQDLHTRVQKHGPKMTVITDAEKGASSHDGTRFVDSPALDINKPVADKTGAGDAFASGYLSALIYGKSLDQALQWGLKNSSSCIREIGPMNGILTRKEIDK
jgi:sugar/nucleoside kinase (ribokinase family)